MSGSVVENMISETLGKIGVTPQAAMDMARGAVLNEQIKKGAPPAYLATCQRNGMTDGQAQASWRHVMEAARDRKD